MSPVMKSASLEARKLPGTTRSPADLRDHRRHDVLDAVRARQVGCQRQRPTAPHLDLLGGMLRGRAIGVDDAHVRALARVAQGNAVADAGAVAVAARGDEGHLVLQTHACPSPYRRSGEPSGLLLPARS